MASPLRIPANVVPLTLTRLETDQESHKPWVTTPNAALPRSREGRGKPTLAIST